MNGQADKQKTRVVKHRHLIFVVIFALLILVAVGSVVYTGYAIFKNTAREYREKIIVDAAKLAAAQVNGDKVNDWFDNGLDGEYYKTQRVLESILLNTPYLQYLYVYRILPDGCHVIYDLETSVEELSGYDEVIEDNGQNFNALIPFDESFSEYIPTLLAGGRIDTLETVDTYGWLMTQYEPVYDSQGNCSAYVGADISMLGVNDNVNSYLIRVAIIAGLFFLGCMLLGGRLYMGVRRADAMDDLVARRQRDKEMLREVIEAFAKVVDLKDSYTRGHSVRVAKYTEMLARELGYDEETVENYYNIALMHDIGKVGIPDSVLNKPGKLTDEEFALIKSHAERGYEVLKEISLMPEVAIGARAHHERPDGKGYPQGLKDGELPRVAQIIAVADCFDAMYSNRPYRPRMNFERAVGIIREVSGTQLTPDVVDAFLRLVDKGEFRAANDHGGGSMESIENIRNE